MGVDGVPVWGVEAPLQAAEMGIEDKNGEEAGCQPRCLGGFFVSVGCENVLTLRGPMLAHVCIKAGVIDALICSGPISSVA